MFYLYNFPFSNTKNQKTRKRRKRKLKLLKLKRLKRRKKSYDITYNIHLKGNGAVCYAFKRIRVVDLAINGMRKRHPEMVNHCFVKGHLSKYMNIALSCHFQI